jgi:hypothetical protein
MSLQTLIEMRKGGHIPGAVWVIVGKPPKFLPDQPDYIVVNPDNFQTDFRAIIGLHVDVFELVDSNTAQVCRLQALYGGIEASKPKSVGVACSDGIIGLNAAHESMLRRTLELLRANTH